MDTSDHPLLKTHEVVMACKKCRKVFRKDARQELEEADEFCPHCDNQYVLAAVEPKPVLAVEGEDGRMFIRDLRMKQLMHDDDLLLN